MEKAADIGALAAVSEREKIAVQKIDTVCVVYLSVEEHMVIAAQAALRDIERKLRSASYKNA